MDTEALNKTLLKPRTLAKLEGELAPTLYGVQPFWRPKPCPVAKDYRPKVIPAWDWTSPTWADHLDETRVSMDANAAWLAAASGVRIGHGALDVHVTGSQDYERRPGYYLVRVYKESWKRWDLPHPLGYADSEYHVAFDGFVWMTHHTYELIVWLHRQDQWWGTPDIVESWTSKKSARLQEWTKWVNGLRAVATMRGDQEAINRIKLSYAQAIEMMPGHEKCNIRRPDWKDAILSRCAAEAWRKAFYAREAGYKILRMHAVDEVVLTQADFHRLLDAPEDQRPFRIDQSGLSLGAYKAKTEIAPGDDE